MKKKLSKLELALKKIAAALQAYVNDHIADIENPHGVTKTQIGLENVTNDAQVKRTEMGVANGVATLGVNGKIPSSQLPTGGGDIIEGYFHNGNFYELEITGLGPEYVEIGGVKWATTNIGAESVTDAGLYFQWADTDGYAPEEIGIGVSQKSFGWTKYKYGNNTSSPGVGGISKYNPIDNKVILDSSDDAASIRFGGNWRLPTPTEYQSLGTAVDTTWTSDYLGSGVAGLICTDKTDNTKVLFFPAAGSANNGDSDLGSVDYSSMYFTIESLEDGNQIKIARAKAPNNPILSYSLDDGETWTTITISSWTTFASINTGDKVILKGNNDQLATSWDTYNYFEATKQFKVYGNIMSLFNGDNFTTNSEFNSNVNHHCAGLFRTTHIVDASNLILPARTLYESSYNGMFRGATALQHGPKMLATTPMGKDCCSSMFEGCINLEEAIEINFTTLTQACCMRMFCMDRNNKLTTPKMTKSPILRCPTPGTDCYREMFAGNGNLNEITCLITTSNVNCTSGWVANAGDGTGTFYRDPSKTDWAYDNAASVPSGWTIIAYTEGILDNGTNGSYWSNTRSTNNVTKASSFIFNSSSINWSNDNSRFKGFSIRAVYDEEGTACIPERGKIYIDVETDIQYRWDDEWIQLTNSDGALLGESSDAVILANLPKKTILDKNNNNILPITHVSAVYNNNGTSVETLLINMDEKIDNKIIEGYYINGSFYTTPITHDYVEIDGVKWATMNLGALSETDYGMYFQWGDTQGYTAAQVGSGEGQKYFSWENYKFNDGTESSPNMTKYNLTDRKSVLDATDDAATVAWGSGWRMPTISEYATLGNAVNKTWTVDYQGSGVAGLILTDKTDSSRELFFPAAGCCWDGTVISGGYTGFYWSSSLTSDNVQRARFLVVQDLGENTDLSSDERYGGIPVRGIYDGSTPTAIIPILGALYIDKSTNVIYRYDGSAYVLLSAAPVSNSYIEAMWSGYDPLASE